MKVGIVVPYSWSFWGGVQEHADHQARALRDLGIEAKILMGHDPPGRLTHLLHPKEGRHERPPDYVVPVAQPEPGLTNAQLWKKHGVALGGAVAPRTTLPGIIGFVSAEAGLRP